MFNSHPRLGNEVVYKEANYTVTWDDLLSSRLIVVDTTDEGQLSVTLPESGTLPNQLEEPLLLRLFLKSSGDSMQVLLSGSDTFPAGNTEENTPGKTGLYEVMYLDDAWQMITPYPKYTSLFTDTSWTSDNFSSLTAITFTSQLYKNNSETMSWGSGVNASRLTIHIGGVYRVSFGAVLATTGRTSGDFTVNAAIYVNGVKQTYTETMVSDADNETKSLMSLPDTITLAADDYLEVKFVQTNLGTDGSIESCKLNVETV